MKLSERIYNAFLGGIVNKAVLAEWFTDAKQLEAELSDIKESHRIVMDEKCPSDEVHCTCVPVLRAENKELVAAVAGMRDKWTPPDEVAQLEAENEALMMAANSLLGLIDCLGGRFSLDDAGSDRKSLAELVDYPDYMNKKIALLTEEPTSDTPISDIPASP